MKTFRVKNFEKYQHYKDRSPPWIKLYNGLLEDYEFGALPDASKMHLIAIWLLASRTNNKMPYDPKWVSGRINATEPVDLDLLSSLGFILLDQELQQAERVASKTPAKRVTREEGQDQNIGKREKEPSSGKRTSGSEDFETLKRSYPRRAGNYGWKAAERKFNSLIKTGVPAKVIIAAAIRLGETLRSKIGTEFIPMPGSWLNSEDFLESAVIAFDVETPIDWNNIVEFYVKNNHWSRHVGPEPGQIGCKAPAEILLKYGIRVGDPERLFTDIEVQRMTA